MSNTPKRLSDLRKLKEMVEFDGLDDDDQPYEMKVWVVKLNDTDSIACREAANAAKARAMIDRGEDSQQWLAAYTEAVGLSDNPEDLAAWLSEFDIIERQVAIQDEVAGAEHSEWAKDDYLEGLFSAWMGSEEEPGLALAWQARDDDPATLDPAVAAQIDQAVKVMDELNRFQQAVDLKLQVEREKYVRDHKDDPIEDLRRKIVDQVLAENANRAWARAYDRSKLYYATRCFSDHRERYFVNPAEVDDTHREFKQKLLDAYDKIAVEGTAGKESPAPQSSSPESGSSDEGETSDSSGPMAATG